MRKVFKRLGLGLLGLILALMFFPDLLLVPFALLFGWVFSAGRLLPGLIAKASSLPWLLFGSLLLLGGTHWFCHWLHMHFTGAGRGGKEGNNRWRWPWTVALNACAWLVFFAIMGLVGIIHQAGWLALSKEPVFVSRNRWLKTKIEMNQVARAIDVAANECAWDGSLTQAAFWKRSFASEADPAWEKFCVVFLRGDGDRVSSAVLIPRDPAARKKLGLTIIEPGTRVKSLPAESLPETLAARSAGSGAWK